MARNDSGYGQDSTRRPGKLTDQHGRKWSASIDKKSGFPVGVIQPNGWRAPWHPNQGHFLFSEDNPTTFTIDYPTLIDQRLKAHEEWAAQYRQAALVRGWDPEDKAKAANVTELVGTKPLPIEPIVACVQGNKWMLGLTDKVDPRLVPFVRKRSDRISRAIEAMDFSEVEDFSPEEEPIGASGILEDQEPDYGDELDKLLDLEEDADPVGIGGKRVAVKQGKKTQRV